MRLISTLRKRKKIIAPVAMLVLLFSQMLPLLQTIAIAADAPVSFSLALCDLDGPPRYVEVTLGEPASDSTPDDSSSSDGHCLLCCGAHHIALTDFNSPYSPYSTGLLIKNELVSEVFFSITPWKLFHARAPPLSA